MSLEEPKSKKAKVQKHEEDDDEEEEYQDEEEEEEEDEDEEKNVKAKRNENGEAYFELSDSRRLAVRQFKGKTLIDIREFYEKGGKYLPGKKGISLSLEQYSVLEDLIKGGHIQKEIKALK